MNQAQQGDIELEPLREGMLQPRSHAPKKEKIKILFEEDLPPEYSHGNLPEELAKKRNLAIQALIVQAVAAVTGLGFVFYQKAIIYLFINLISLVLVYYGFEGATSLQKTKIAVHSLITMGVLGTSWVYYILVFFFSGSNAEDMHLSERATLFLLGLPYLIDLVCGIITFSLTIYVFKLEEAREKHS